MSQTDSTAALCSYYEDLMDKTLGTLPEHDRKTIRDYILDGVPMGSFLSACFADKLVGAFVAADGENRVAMAAIAGWMYWNCPAVARGSYEAVKEWIDGRGVRGGALTMRRPS